MSDKDTQTASVALPYPGMPEASAMIESVLAEFNYPSNMKNAARAGYVAAMRMLEAVHGRDPISAEAARDLINDAGLDWHNGWTVGDDATNRYLDLIRAIERAHGIIKENS